MTVIVNIFSLVVFEIKNVVIIQIKHCTHCECYYHVKSECRNKHSHLKRDRDQSDRSDRDDRDNKRRRENDNDNNNNNDARNEDDENVEKFHKLYIIMFFETLSTMSVMLAQTTFWVLNNACFQHNIRKKSTFISYTIVKTLISISDLRRSIYVMSQETIRVICKIDHKRMNISFFDVFYVSKCFLNLINFDQLDEIRCLMSYKSDLFAIENQDIITKKRVNNVFFFELWKHVSYNFIVTFIVDNLIEQSIKSNFTINKKTLNVWHARLKHLKKQNVRRLVNMFERMNLIKIITNKNLCKSCT